MEKASTLDKLLGQLGIYTTWLSSIAYLQKKIAYFLYFLRHIFLAVITYVFLLNEALLKRTEIVLWGLSFEYPQHMFWLTNMKVHF